MIDLSEYLASITMSRTKCMAKSRHDTVNILNLPDEMIVGIRNMVSANTSTEVMKTLSSTCSTLYNFFKPDLDQQAAQQLLTYVIHGDVKNAQKMYIANPRLLFIESTAKEYAAGIDEEGNSTHCHRIVRVTPLRAMAGCGDIWMLEALLDSDELKQYVDIATNKSGMALAAEQILQQFPNGFDYPLSTYHFKPIIDAIINDQQLIQSGIPSEALHQLLVQFRKDFMPGLVTSGHFFNLNELVRAFELFDENRPWEIKQGSLFWREIIGYLERLVTGIDAQVISQGILHVIEAQNPARCFDVTQNFVRKVNVSYFPLDLNPTLRLGLSGAVDSWQASAFASYAVCPAGAIFACLQSLCQIKVKRLEKLMQNLQQQLNKCQDVSDKRAGCIML